VLAKQLAGGRVEEADLVPVPLDGHRAPDPAGRSGVVGAVHLDTAVEVDGAGAIAIGAEGLDGKREQGGSLLGEHGGNLALGGAVDAGVGPAGLPVVEGGLGLLQALEAEPLERRGLGVPDGRRHFPLPIVTPPKSQASDRPRHRTERP
jgi:hypothetical protein